MYRNSYVNRYSSCVSTVRADVFVFPWENHQLRTALKYWETTRQENSAAETESEGIVDLE